MRDGIGVNGGGRTLLLVKWTLIRIGRKASLSGC